MASDPSRVTPVCLAGRDFRLSGLASRGCHSGRIDSHVAKGHGVIDRQRSKTVVVGVDGTPGGLEAVAWAACEARLRGQRLRIVHACTTHDPSRLDQAYEMLDDAEHRAHDIIPSVDVQTDLEADDPVLLLER